MREPGRTVPRVPVQARGGRDPDRPVPRRCLIESLLTIGHSQHEWDDFAGLLRRHGITAIADVRSSPFSGRFPQFNREPLQHALGRGGVAYAFLGDALGARRDEPECYDGRTARYDLIARSPRFQAGLERVREGLRRHRIALLCSEKDPITCHRMVLVCRHLRDESLEMGHVLADGAFETQAAAETRLMASFDLAGDDLFRTHDDRLEEAYDRQGARIAWVETEDPGDLR